MDEVLEDQSVTHAVNRLNETRLVGVAFDFFTQRCDRLVHRAGEQSRMTVPHALQQLLARERDGGMFVKMGNQFEFLGAKSMLARWGFDTARAPMNHRRADAEDCGCRTGPTQ